MTELVLESSSDARPLFEDFQRRHPEGSWIETSKGADGMALITLVIEQGPQIATSLAILIAAVRGQGLRVKASKDGLDVSIGELAKDDG